MPLFIAGDAYFGQAMPSLMSVDESRLSEIDRSRVLISSSHLGRIGTSRRSVARSTPAAFPSTTPSPPAPGPLRIPAGLPRRRRRRLQPQH
jgi:hypothetical protein